jgi:hypothetical protein
VDIAYVNPVGGGVVTGHLGLFVVPHSVYVVAGQPTRTPDSLQAALEAAPFAAPPTEAALEAVFVRAMSQFADTGRGRARRKAALQERVRSARLADRHVPGQLDGRDHPGFQLHRHCRPEGAGG